MKDKPNIPGRKFYGLAFLSILAGLLLSTWTMSRAGLASFPDRIAEAYAEEQHLLSVPGSREVSLTRSGAYGIYYVSSPSVVHQKPPAISCSIGSLATGSVIDAAPDYVETNRYWTKDRSSTSVLIMSLTVEKPGTYTFNCRYPDGRSQPKSVVALGPNYVWEFFRALGKIGIPLFAGVSIMCGSGVLALLIVLVVAIQRYTSSQEHANG